MSLAIERAKQGLGNVSPNPPVGAVFLDSENRLLSTGFHKACGGDHAEIHALKNFLKKNSLEKLRNGALYVTLEPCSHHGRTPPCVDKLSSLPLSRICIGLKDPNPEVSGKGISRLKKSPIKVEMYQGDLKESLEELIEIFSYNMKFQKPFVALKIASSLDSKITSPYGRWVSSKSSRNYVSFLRGCYDSVCIGVETFLKDQPRLNPRHPAFRGQMNKVVILDPEGRSFSYLKDSPLLKVRHPSHVIIVSAVKMRKSGLYRSSLLHQEAPKGLFDIDSLLKTLFQKGVYSLLVEGGGETFSSFLRHTQRLYLFLSPLVAGKEQLSWTEGLGNYHIKMRSVQYSHFEKDILITGRL